MLTAYKAAKRSCALMMLDLDRFKQVNDTLGHPAGDELLKQVAQRLERIVGDTGEIGRLGGDEFQIILPDIDDRGKLGEIANDDHPDDLAALFDRRQPRDHRHLGRHRDRAVRRDRRATSWSRSADLALYAAKGGGRGQFRFYSSDLQGRGAGAPRRSRRTCATRSPSGELELHYQPVVAHGDQHGGRASRR